MRFIVWIAQTRDSVTLRGFFHGRANARLVTQRHTRKRAIGKEKTKDGNVWRAGQMRDRDGRRGKERAPANLPDVQGNGKRSARADSTGVRIDQLGETEQGCDCEGAGNEESGQHDAHQVNT
ncbi:hypothetical protein [Paraburkholderia acidisoli]|uniref:Uncharacterized protein n=1 Tax=Paraburkholderia acidisoli TaxID=2571748 RepID=A0A7Z2JES3_9BURK|nr:hypothetical protein [Paraburkholderia acidisoli]QGZ61193.1 hypothetical protein FAZ98_05305 [Paraburkholderia acidisoli]